MKGSVQQYLFYSHSCYYVFHGLVDMIIFGYVPWQYHAFCIWYNNSYVSEHSAIVILYFKGMQYGKTMFLSLYHNNTVFLDMFKSSSLPCFDHYHKIPLAKNCDCIHKYMLKIVWQHTVSKKHVITMAHFFKKFILLFMKEP